MDRFSRAHRSKIEAINRYKRSFYFGHVQVKDEKWRPFISSILIHYKDLNTSEPFNSVSNSKIDNAIIFDSLLKNCFIRREDFMERLGLRTYTALPSGQPPQDYANWQHRVENMLDLWQLFFPDRGCLTISQVEIQSVQSFIKFATDVLHDWRIPRELPSGMLLLHTEDARYYRESFYKIWKLQINHDKFETIFLKWYPNNASGVDVFLETWIDEIEPRDKDIAAMTKAIFSLRNQYGSIESFSIMNNTRLGNVFASLFRKCGHRRRSIEAANDFLQNMLEIIGRHRIRPIFNAIARRLHKHELILSLYLFTRAIADSTPQEFKDMVSDLIATVDGELSKIEGDTNNLGLPSLRTCFHITLYLESRSDFWEASDDISLFYYLNKIAEQVIGPWNRQLWCCIEEEKKYDQAKIKIKAMENEFSSHFGW